jgi:hypothetical protein
MKRTLILMLTGILPFSANAMEASASGNTQAAQSAVTAINSKLDSSLAALQVMITGMQNCSAQRKFYAPGDARRDANNCVSQGAYELADTGVDSGDPGQFRMPAGSYGTFWRNDGGNTYLLLTNAGDQYGGWNGLRPFYVNDASGSVNVGQGLTVTGGLTTNTNDGTWALVGNAFGSGVGVYGYAANNWSGYFTGLDGAYGQGTSGPGVQGSSASNWGGLFSGGAGGVNGSSGGGVGVQGSSTNNWAGYFSGSSGVSGISGAGWAGYFHSQGTQNGVYHIWGGSYCISGSCQLANPYTGGCSCEPGYASYVSANQNDRSGTWHTSYTCYK